MTEPESYEICDERTRDDEGFLLEGLPEDDEEAIRGVPD